MRSFFRTEKTQKRFASILALILIPTLLIAIIGSSRTEAKRSAIDHGRVVEITEVPNPERPDEVIFFMTIEDDDGLQRKAHVEGRDFIKVGCHVKFQKIANLRHPNLVRATQINK